MATPKKWKLMLITWLFVYPVINILFITVFPLVKDAHQLIKTLVLTLILVPLIGIFVPKIHRKFDTWIRK
jgi:antibiotic biosynthesis monooxygenase (ABM) superfamily enzyme